MGHSAAGPSLLDKLWHEMDNVVARLISDGAPAEKPEAIINHGLDRPDPLAEWADEYRRWGEDRGQAQGLAFAIATIENPYNPNMDDVRARAMERWQGHADHEE